MTDGSKNYSWKELQVKIQGMRGALLIRACAGGRTI